MKGQKTYSASREHGANIIRVTFQSEKGMPQNYTLDPAAARKVSDLSPGGFEWGHAGSAPAMTALAILLDCVGFESIAESYYQAFKREFIERSPAVGFVVHESEIRAWLRLAMDLGPGARS
jgi:hypothetical protein